MPRGFRVGTIYERNRCIEIVAFSANLLGFLIVERYGIEIQNQLLRVVWVLLGRRVEKLSLLQRLLSLDKLPCFHAYPSQPILSIPTSKTLGNEG